MITATTILVTESDINIGTKYRLWWPAKIGIFFGSQLQDFSFPDFFKKKD